MNSLSKTIAFTLVGLAILIPFALPTPAEAAYSEITRVVKSIGSSGAWADIDMSVEVPAGATGVCGEMYITSGTRNIGVRKNGSTDNRTNSLNDTSHAWFCIGVDSSRIFEAFCGDAAQCRYAIEAYTTDDAVFNTNATDKSLGTTAAWTDIDISADTTGTATCAVIEAVGSTAGAAFGLRMNGSTDNRINSLATDFMHQFGLVGVDSSELLEGYIGSLNTDMFLVGYMTKGCTGLTNGTDKSLGSTGVYTDLTASPTDAIGTAIEVISTSDLNFNIRKNGATNNNQYSLNQHTWAIVPTDRTGIAEGLISNTAVDFFETAYFTPLPNYYAESNATTTAAVTTWTDKTTLTLVPENNATYYIVASAVINSNGTLNDFRATLVNTTASTTLAEQVWDADATTEQYTFAVVATTTFGATPSPQVYKIRFATAENADTISVASARIFAIKKGANDQDAYSDGNSTSANNVWVDKTTLTFTPATTGDYVILASLEGFSSPTGEPYAARLDIDGTAYSEYTNINNDPDERNPWAIVKRINLSNTSHTIKIQFRNNDIATPSGNVTVRRGQIVAIRADAYQNNYYAEDETRTTNNTTTFNDKTTLTTTPLAQPHVYFASGLFDDTTGGGEEGIIRFTDGTYNLFEGRQRSDSASTSQMMYFTMYSTTTANVSTTWKTQWATQVNDVIGHKDSRISILELSAAVAAAAAASPVEAILMWFE